MRSFIKLLLALMLLVSSLVSISFVATRASAVDFLFGGDDDEDENAGFDSRGSYVYGLYYHVIPQGDAGTDKWLNIAWHMSRDKMRKEDPIRYWQLVDSELKMQGYSKDSARRRLVGQRLREARRSVTAQSDE